MGVRLVAAAVFLWDLSSTGAFVPWKFIEEVRGGCNNDTLCRLLRAAPKQIVM
jgi:hypothetical protein